MVPLSQVNMIWRTPAPSRPTLTHSTFAAGRLVGDRQKTWLGDATWCQIASYGNPSSETEAKQNCVVVSTHPPNIKYHIWESIGIIFTRCFNSRYLTPIKPSSSPSLVFHRSPTLFRRTIMNNILSRNQCLYFNHEVYSNSIFSFFPLKPSGFSLEKILASVASRCRRRLAPPALKSWSTASGKRKR